MTIAIALLVLLPSPLNGATETIIRPNVASDERKVLDRFLASILLKDEATMRALANQEVPVEPELDSRPGLKPTTLEQVLKTTRACVLGAASHSYSIVPSYVVNWWCEFADVKGERIPVAGNSASLRVVNGKVQLQNFTYGRWGPAPRLKN